MAQVLFRLIASILLWRDLARNAWVEGLIAFHGPKFCMYSIMEGSPDTEPYSAVEDLRSAGFRGLGRHGYSFITAWRE